MAKPVLGRGLGALLGGNPVPKTSGPAINPAATAAPAAPPPAEGERVQKVPFQRIRPCPFQPRKVFSDASLKELADSIKEQGILQPLTVRERNGGFELIAGERRWRAAQLLGLGDVPVIVREADDGAVLELALIENLQREDLNALEEAQGYAQLIEQFGLTQEETAAKVGKSRAAVANALRLLKLPPSVQTQIKEGHLSVGHAKVILGLPSSQLQQTAAERIVKEGLNVRQTETLVAGLLAPKPTETTSPGAAPEKRDPHVARLEDKLRERLGTKVRLRYSGGKGAMEIAFFSDAELERLLGAVGVAMD